MYDPRLQPLSVGEILNAAIRIYRSRFLVLVRLVAIFVVPVEVVSGIVRGLTVSNISTGTASSPRLAAGGWSGVAGNLVVNLLLGLASQLATAASLKAVSDAYVGHPTTWRESINFVLDRVGSVFVVAFLIFSLAFFGLVLFLVPGVYFWVAWLVAMPVLLIENQHGMAALRRSRELVRTRWWPTLGAYVMALVFSGIVSIIVSTLLFGVFSSAKSGTGADVLAQAVAASLSAILTTPFVAAVIALVYFDLRVRKEGLDLHVLAHGVGIDPASLPLQRPDFSRHPQNPPYPDIPSRP